jgi:hypothetical protein
MSRTASIPVSFNFLERCLAAVDHWLTQSARISARNGDLPYFGL